jgi:histidinol-phosphate/aromatic aminotransferase/cobyric acid decarboxylase-like protein/GNAT superfamily N-acetyltransferase
MRPSIVVAEAGPAEREVIYGLRHAVYARELGQHAENAAGRLIDALDAFNVYLLATMGGEIAGFISITPPGRGRYSIDKYFSRHELPFPIDDGVYEIRLLTVLPKWRGQPLAFLLMHAAHRWIDSRGGKRIVAIGRREVLGLYRKVGLEPLGLRVQAGAVHFELMTAEVQVLRRPDARHVSLLGRLEWRVDWRLPFAFRAPAACYHGGAFFEAIGEEFDDLHRISSIISADVLDAWFPPSPRVLAAVEEYLPWLLKTSPPTACSGLVRAIARARHVPPNCIVPGAGSSNLIFLALRHWLKRDSHVLLLDPTYGEYGHVLENVIGCRVTRLPLRRASGYEVDLEELAARLSEPCDLCILVNPNSPTGRHVPRKALEDMLCRVAPRARVWVDETYIEYAGEGESLEGFATQSENVVVCKSMSKMYALSGARVAYLCAPAPLAAELLAITPPWAVSLPAQVAAVAALADPRYYAARYLETHRLRVNLARDLHRAAPMEIVPSVANFLLCHLPEDGPTAAEICERCRAQGLFLRNAGEMSRGLGAHALRIAVKDAETNRRIVEILSGAVGRVATHVAGVRAFSAAAGGLRRPSRG